MLNMSEMEKERQGEERIKALISGKRAACHTAVPIRLTVVFLAQLVTG